MSWKSTEKRRLSAISESPEAKALTYITEGQPASSAQESLFSCHDPNYSKNGLTC